MINPGKALGRVMLGAIFVANGANHVRHPEHLEGMVEPGIKKYLGANAQSPLPPKQTVQVYGGVLAVAGTALALGKFKRLSAATLVAGLVPSTLLGHAFWEESDPAKRSEQQVQFLKNVAIAGGLLQQVFDIPPIPHINRPEINLPDVDLSEALPSTKDLKKVKKNVLGHLGA